MAHLIRRGIAGAAVVALPVLGASCANPEALQSQVGIQCAQGAERVVVKQVQESPVANRLVIGCVGLSGEVDVTGIGFGDGDYTGKVIISIVTSGVPGEPNPRTTGQVVPGETIVGDDGLDPFTHYGVIGISPAPHKLTATVG